MSTGSVNPFTPNQPTQVLVAGTVSASITFNPCDALLIFNSGTVTVLVDTGNALDPATAILPGGTTGSMGSFPIPAGTEHLLGAPGVVGNAAGPITQLAAIVSTGTATLYVTPGLGTEY